MTSSLTEQTCTMLVHSDRNPNQVDLKKMLESADPGEKAEAMKQVIALILNGEQLDQLFFTIVRYVLPTDNHLVQKLLLLYLETIKKTDASGKLLPEMILICQNLRNNLQHPNEFLRGVTLRFLCRIHEEDILEPLVPSILACLDHRKAYVRRNAVLAVDSVAKLPKGDVLIPDAAEVIDKFLRQEEDPSARRNAFHFLINHAETRALQFLVENKARLVEWQDTMQMAGLQLVRKACRTQPAQRGTFVQIVLAFVQSSSPSVVFEAAYVLTQLSQAPTAIRAVANCYVQLLVSQSDNNVKLIVLDRIASLRDKHQATVKDFLMDLLRALNTQSMEVRKKVLDLALGLVSKGTIDEVVQVLKKEIVRSQSKDVEGGPQYRQLLIAGVHRCAVRFPSVAPSVVHLLMDFLGDSSAASALEVVHFVREIAEASPDLRATVMSRLVDTFRQTRSGRVCASSLWVMSEYAATPAEVRGALETLRTSLGDLPLISPDADRPSDPAAPAADAPRGSTRTVVLPDGSYATQTAVTEQAMAAKTAGVGPQAPNVRALVLGGDYFLAAVAATTVAKLLFKLRSMGAIAPEAFNLAAAQYMLFFTAVLRLGEAPGTAPVDTDSYDRIMLAMQALTSKDAVLQQLFLDESRRAFERMIAERNAAAAAEGGEAVAQVQPDAPVDIPQLRSQSAAQGAADDDDLVKATGFTQEDRDASSRQRTLQLTGLSDPVYAEALVTVHQYDIVMDVTLINRTQEHMRNLVLELATMGDLKVVERPAPLTLSPGEARTVRANIKVSSTETGVVFGNVVYEGKGYGERSVVVMNDVHVDIMDYIHPATVPDAQFRSMWAEFEWENKVSVNTRITEPRDFLEHICRATNMRCLTPPNALDGESRFLAANLYARSVFGEDALVNMSVEKTGAGTLEGHIRIRSKTQGIALALGDKITLQQHQRT